MSKDIEEFFKVALLYTKEAGKLVRERSFNRDKAVEIKSCDIDFVTQTDQDVEKLLINNLTEKFPNHKFIGEESVAGGAQCELTDDPTWIIDPIDGTMNFVHSFPHSCISIALFINKEPFVAIIYNPVLEQLFTAVKGQGAFLNEKPIKVSGQTDLTKALLMLEIGTSRSEARVENIKSNMNSLVTHVHGLRSLGSAALDMAMVALGGADAYFEFGIHIWDFAAGELIVKEAGGVVIDPAGGPIDRFSRRVLAASSQTLADQLIPKLTQIYPTPRD